MLPEACAFPASNTYLLPLSALLVSTSSARGTYPEKTWMNCKGMRHHTSCVASAISSRDIDDVDLEKL